MSRPSYRGVLPAGSSPARRPISPERILRSTERWRPRTSGLDNTIPSTFVEEDSRGISAKAEVVSSRHLFPTIDREKC